MYQPKQASQFRVLASAARTVTNSTGIFRPPRDMRGIRIFIETTAASTSSTVFSIEVKDNLNSQWHALVSSAAVTATGRASLETGPGVAIIANVSTGRHVGSGVRVTATHGNANSHTYNIVGEWLP